MNLKSLYKVKKKVELYSVISITAGGHHAWLESNVGPIRKPLASIPDDLLTKARAE